MPELTRFALPAEFWTRFVERHWERAPGVFPDLFPAPILSPLETWQSFSAAFTAFRSGGEGDRPRCYLDDAEVTDGPGYARFFPLPEDASMEAYGARLSAAFGPGRTFAVVINAFHVHSRALWYRLRGFCRGLYAVTGLPASRTDPVLFFGDYRQTPFGVHSDAASVFTFNLSGAPKRVLAWPEPYFARRGVAKVPERVLEPPAAFAADAVDQCIGPVDLMYWPSSHWHVGVAEQGLHASLGVGVYFAASPADLLAGVWPLALGPTERPLTALPLDPEPLLDAVQRALSGAALRRELHGELLRRMTSDGLQPPPPIELQPLSPDDRVQLAGTGPIVTAPVPPGLLVAANGYSWFLSDAGAAAAFLAAVDELNRGDRVRVGPVLRKSGPISEQVWETFIGLCAADAIHKVKAS